MEIKFYNHACFSVLYKENFLLCDPYLTGAVFNNGWDLIVENIPFNFDYNKKNFIYFSHEHPDHFSVNFIKSIDVEQRANITILYQKTMDNKVKKFAKNLGYKFIEIKNLEKFLIDDNFEVLIGQVPFYDSWALINVDGKKILNLNDCVLEDPRRVFDIKKIVNKTDILFTQFSYANWIEGGANSIQERQKFAREKLRRIKHQAKILKPNFIVPFASMIRFCHEENEYMNDSVNTPKDTVEYIDKHVESIPHLLVPFETWNGIDKKNNYHAIQYWEKAYKSAFKRELKKTEITYDKNQLFSAYYLALSKVKKQNNYYLIKFFCLIGLYPSVKFFINDINITMSFSWYSGFEEVKKTKTQKDKDTVSLSSESLHFIFSNDFGVDTINVNARFNGSLISKKRLIRCFSIFALNNTGRYISVIGIVNLLKDLSFLKQGLKTIGLLVKKT